MPDARVVWIFANAQLIASARLKVNVTKVTRGWRKKQLGDKEVTGQEEFKLEKMHIICIFFSRCDRSLALVHHLTTMILNRFSDYALRVLMFAAVRDHEPFSIEEVAGKYALSKNHVAKVVNRLVHIGHLRARRGPRGGVWLGRDPKTIRLGALVRLTENDSPLVECFAAKTNRCRLTPSCRLKRVLAEALEAFYKRLDQQTLADLVENRGALASLLEDQS